MPTFRLTLLGSERCSVKEHFVIGGEGMDVRAVNSSKDPNKVKPRKGDGLGVDEGRKLNGSLKPLSYHVVRLAPG